ncbi:MAG TPA: YggS family pyridoxal phosphate-dependent enzyme [Acidimicrobiales bacterium]|jgi:pyridoxal phosphate enzyme (YggS family)|nr:YggS family pyridoxal phosphate-dependent enzyme [Acidimicrobiales bacterium]
MAAVSERPRAFEVRDRLAAVRERIEKAGGDPGAVRVVAVTKGFGVDAVRAAVDAGLADIGESYAQEMVAKAAELRGQDPAATPSWHFVGRLQRNKVRKVAPHVALWHSVDRLPLGAEIARLAPRAAVLVQVNTSGEPTKAGCPPEATPGLVDGLVAAGLDVRGLMTIAPAGPPEAARPSFRALSELAQRLGLRELSMGMSDDLEVAVEEGATIVRVGRDLFGPRPDPRGHPRPHPRHGSPRARH